VPAEPNQDVANWRREPRHKVKAPTANGIAAPVPATLSHCATSPASEKKKR